MTSASFYQTTPTGTQYAPAGPPPDPAGQAYAQQQQLDPATGQPYPQSYDPATGQPYVQQYDPATGQPVGQPTAAAYGTGVALPAVAQPGPSSDIGTLPVIAPEEYTGYPMSRRTGEPRRPVLLLIAIVFNWLSVAGIAGAFAWWWRQSATVTGFHGSARLLTWTQPDPTSAGAVALVIAIGAMTVLMGAAGGTAAYNTWAGNGWIRIGGLVCLAVLGLSFLLNWWFSAAMIPLALGVALVWLPPCGKFFKAMAEFRAPKVVAVKTSGILYGPQTLIGSPLPH